MDIPENFPLLFIEKMKRIYGEDNFESVLNAFNPRLPSFRINTIKAKKEDVIQNLTNQGFKLQQVAWYQDAYILTNKSLRELTDTDNYKHGEIYIQNLSSMIPALVMHPQKHEKILDLAAAPGSKTTQLAALMNNTGEITANDLSRKRIFKLKANLLQQGVINTKIINFPGESLWKRFPEYFDKTLVDVPCSMEGRFQLSDPKTYDSWSPKKNKQLARLQKFLLRSAISATKIGGEIIYSTCTLSPEENEEIIDWILKKTHGAVITQQISIQNLNTQLAIPAWNKQTFTHLHCLRIKPTQVMEGFFVTKLHKIASTLL